MGTVYRGLKPVPHEEAMEHFEGTHVSIDDMSGFYGRVNVYANPEEWISWILLIT